MGIPSQALKGRLLPAVSKDAGRRSAAPAAMVRDARAVPALLTKRLRDAGSNMVTGAPES